MHEVGRRVGGGGGGEVKSIRNYGNPVFNKKRNLNFNTNMLKGTTFITMCVPWSQVIIFSTYVFTSFLINIYDATRQKA